MTFFRINSKSLSKNPTNIEQGKTKIVKTDRTIDGTLVADIIAIKNKVTVSWDYITSADLAKLIAEVNRDVFPIVEYNEGDTIISMAGHTEELTYAPYYSSRTGFLWKDVKVSFVER